MHSLKSLTAAVKHFTKSENRLMDSFKEGTMPEGFNRVICNGYALANGPFLLFIDPSTCTYYPRLLLGVSDHKYGQVEFWPDTFQLPTHVYKYFLERLSSIYH